MLCKVVGVQQMDFTLDNGYHFAGKKIHVIDLEKKPDGLTGHVVTSFKIPNENQSLSLMQILPDQIYKVYFEQDGRTIAFMQKDNGVNVGK